MVNTIEIFSDTWWKWIPSTILVLVIILLLAARANEVQKTYIRYCAAGCLILSAILIHPYLYWVGKWTVQTSLPLHMCTIAQWLAIWALLNPRQWSFNILAFWGIGGGLNALITPQPLHGGEFPILLEYVIEHGGIVFTPLFLALVYQMRPSKKSWVKIYIMTQVVIVVMATFNYFSGSNYFFLMEKPLAQSPFIIGDWPWYIIGFQLFGLVQFYIIYFIFKNLQIFRFVSTRKLPVKT